MRIALYTLTGCAAGVFRSILFSEFARKLCATISSYSAFKNGAGRINLIHTVRETLQFFPYEDLVHRYVLKKNGKPCEYAYQFLLHGLLSSKPGKFWLENSCEMRSNSEPGNPPRLDIMLASNGERYAEQNGSGEGATVEPRRARGLAARTRG